MYFVRSLLAVCIMALVVGLPSSASAQSASAIAYGQTVTGEITDAQTALTFTFKAAANDIIVVTMRQAESDSSLAPHLIVQDSQQQTIADSADQVALYSVNLAAQLSGAGAYTITATSADSKSTGKFELTLSKATVMTPATPVKGQASSDSVIYYAYTSGNPFSLVYAKQAGDFAPTVAVNRLDNHELKLVGSLGGEQVDQGSLGIKPNQNELYIITVGEGALDINLSQVTADYSLTLTTSQ